MAMWNRQDEAEALKARFLSLKLKAGTSQAAFARDHAVPGGASMISQHLSGHRPMNMEHALAYARGFGVTLAEISPRLAEQAASVSDYATSHARTEQVTHRATTREVESAEGDADPVQPSPTLGATIIQLGALLAALSPMGLKSVASLLEDVLKNPALAADAAATADAIARTQRLPVKDDFVSSSFGRAQKQPVETGFTPIDEKV